MSEPSNNRNKVPRSLKFNLPPLPFHLKKIWIDYREKILEWSHVYLHTYIVLILLLANSYLMLSSIFIFFGQWKGVDSGVIGFLKLFYNDPPIGYQFLLQLFYVPLHHHVYWYFIVMNMPILTWMYSTATQPVKKGYKTIISFVSERGRLITVILSSAAFVSHFIGIIAWYIRSYLFDFFAGITAGKNDYLVVDSMESFGYVLMCIPIVVVFIILFSVLREVYKEEELRESFFKWRLSMITKYTFSLKDDSCDVIVGWDKKTNEPRVLKENNRFMHESVVGATGVGKTSTAILIRIVQDLVRIARGRKLGVIVLEPKGDLVQDTLTLCEKLGIPDELIKIIDPTNQKSINFSPFIGPEHQAAETFRGILDSLTENQDEFFKGQQGETAANYTMLGKIRFGDHFSMMHFADMYNDPRYLADIVEEVRTQLDDKLRSLNESSEEEANDVFEERMTLNNYNRVVSYFEDQVIEYLTYQNKGVVTPRFYPDNHRHAGRQMVQSKKDNYVAGAKKFVNDITNNMMLSKLMVPRGTSEVLNLDDFLENGGVLVVNTALGELEGLSIIFGQFFIRQLQSSVFRRPGNSNTRIPIFFTADEAALYLNAAFERLFTLGRSYRFSTLIGYQSLGQLKDIKPGFENIVLNSTRSKTVFGGGDVDDNEKFSRMFGEEEVVEESLNESTTPISMPNQTHGLRHNTAKKLAPRFSPTAIKEQKFKHFIFDSLDESGAAVAPVAVVGKFVSETRFLKKFMKVGQLQLLTEQETEELELTDTHKSMLTALMAEPKKYSENLQTTDEEGTAQAITDPISVLPNDEATDSEEGLGLPLEVPSEQIFSQPKLTLVHSSSPIAEAEPDVDIFENIHPAVDSANDNALVIFPVTQDPVLEIIEEAEETQTHFVNIRKEEQPLQSEIPEKVEEEFDTLIKEIKEEMDNESLILNKLPVLEESVQDIDDNHRKNIESTESQVPSELADLVWTENTDPLPTSFKFSEAEEDE